MSVRRLAGTAGSSPLSRRGGLSSAMPLTLHPADALNCDDHSRIIRRKPGGCHGQRPSAQQQGKEETEAGQEQEKRRRRRPLAVRRHAQPDEPERLREEVVARALERRRTPFPAGGGSTREALRGGAVQRRHDRADYRCAGACCPRGGWRLYVGAPSHLGALADAIIGFALWLAGSVLWKATLWG
jgi:hypothetical protein